MESKRALFQIKDCEVRNVGLLVEIQTIILKDLNKLEKIIGYINSEDIIPELKIEIIKNIIKEAN